jgi:hypothetical protein
VADILTAPEDLGGPQMGAGAPVGVVNAQMGQAARRSDYEALFTTKAKELVKGVGHVTNNGIPLTEQYHAGEILTKATQAALDVRSATMRGVRDTDAVIGSMSTDFRAHQRFAPLSYQLNRSSELNKSFTAGNQGFSGTPYGLVPFDLLAPSRLIYPVYTLFRNKFPRPAGQGAARQVYGLLGISGSQTGGQGIVDISMPEVISTSSNNFSTQGNWPLNLPKTGSQTEFKLSVPYRFFGLTESLSWLAQFEGQGFEDISALANLVLLQEMMLGEEYQLLAGSSQSIPTPGAVTATARTALSNETAITGYTTNVNFKVTALNYFGETAVSAAIGTAVAIAAGQVVDVTIAPVAGAQQYNIYMTTNAGTYYLLAGTSVQSSVTYQGSWTANSVGGLRFTAQGAVSTATNGGGAAGLGTSANITPPTTDSGTGGGNRMEGLIPVLSGLSATGSGPYTNVGFESSNVWKGGYINQSVGTHLSTNAIFTALDALWENNGLNNVAPGVYKADPSEIVADGGDLMRLANDMLLQGNSLNYLLNISQDQISGIRAGAAVAEFVNPVTRSTVKLTVHPWMSQGTALLMSYQLPQTWSHVDNAWEMTVVQDYISVAWPVIDATFRYSIFLLGSLVSHAPMYSGILQGLQVSDTTPYS